MLIKTLGFILGMFITTASAMPTTREVIHVQTPDVKEVEQYIDQLVAGDVLFLDVDDTLIAPLTAMLRSSSPDRRFIDEIKKNPHTVKDFPKLLGSWRLARKAQLVAGDWPKIIKKAREREVLVYALTQMDTGEVGPIKRVEEWRHKELTLMNIEFTPTFQGKEDVLFSGNKNENPGAFYKGIFFTGSLSKGSILKKYLKGHHPKKIVFVDDRPEQVEDIVKVARQNDVSVVGVVYEGAHLLPGTPDPDVSAFQKKLLIEENVWLEDEEAAFMLREQK